MKSEFCVEEERYVLLPSVEKVLQVRTIGGRSDIRTYYYPVAACPQGQQRSWRVISPYPSILGPIQLLSKERFLKERTEV